MQNQKKQFKSKVSVSDMSQLVNTTIKKVLKDKIEHCVKQAFENKPYITWISKNQLIEGHSHHFKDLPSQHPLRARMISYWNRPGHLPIRRPTDAAYKTMEQKYGIVFPWPPLGLLDCVQEAFRNIIDEYCKNNAEIAFAPCKGYINKEGKLIDPSWNKHEPWVSQKISGYLIWRTDEESLNIIHDYVLNEADIRMYLQIERTKYTCHSIANTQITRGENIQQLADQRRGSWASIEQLPSKEPIEDWTPYMIESEGIEENTVEEDDE